MPPSIWTYSDGADRGFGLFKRRILQQLNARGWTTWMAEAPLLDPGSKPLLRDDLLQRHPDWILLINQTASQLYDYLAISPPQRPFPCRKWIWFLDDPHFFVDRAFEREEYVFVLTAPIWNICINSSGRMRILAAGLRSGKRRSLRSPLRLRGLFRRRRYRSVRPPLATPAGYAGLCRSPGRS
jgi:hypothetical protein